MGVVEKVGDGVTNFKEGQRVTALGWRAAEGSGSWQQYVTLKQELLVSLHGAYVSERSCFFIHEQPMLVAVVHDAVMQSFGSCPSALPSLALAPCPVYAGLIHA